MDTGIGRSVRDDTNTNTTGVERKASRASAWAVQRPNLNRSNAHFSLLKRADCRWITRLPVLGAYKNQGFRRAPLLVPPRLRAATIRLFVSLVSEGGVADYAFTVRADDGHADRSGRMVRHNPCRHSPVARHDDIGKGIAVEPDRKAVGKPGPAHDQHIVLVALRGLNIGDTQCSVRRLVRHLENQSSHLVKEVEKTALLRPEDEGCGIDDRWTEVAVWIDRQHQKKGHQAGNSAADWAPQMPQIEAVAPRVGCCRTGVVVDALEADHDATWPAEPRTMHGKPIAIRDP